MFISLNDVAKCPGEFINIKLTFDFSNEELYDGIFPFQDPIIVEGKAENKHGVTTVSVSISTKLRLRCDRCAEMYSLDQELFQSVIATMTESEDEANIFLNENFSFDIEEWVRTSLFLEIPIKLLCSDACKGLCSTCGKNLNFEKCSCAE